MLLDFGIGKDDTPFLVMDYAPQGTLRQRHTRGEHLPLPTILTYVRPMAAALQYAHDQHVIHRDVKPENMPIGHHGVLLLSDFGLALIARSTDVQSHQLMAGTIHYMAPEQIQGQPCPASDQYALGTVVYEWLCSDRPFHNSFQEIITQHLYTPPPPLRERMLAISPDVEQAVLKTLAKDPLERFARVEDFALAWSGPSRRPKPFLPLPLQFRVEDHPLHRRTRPSKTTPWQGQNSRRWRHLQVRCPFPSLLPQLSLPGRRGRSPVLLYLTVSAAMPSHLLPCVHPIRRHHTHLHLTMERYIQSNHLSHSSLVLTLLHSGRLDPKNLYPLSSSA